MPNHPPVKYSALTPVPVESEDRWGATRDPQGVKTTIGVDAAGVLTFVQNNTTTLQKIMEKGQSNGYASLDVTAKVPVSQMPDTVTNHIVSTSNPHSVTKADIGLGNVENLKVNLIAVVAPTASDDNVAGYAVGSRWIDTVGDNEYVCVDNATAAAVWVATTTSAAVTSVFSRTGAVVAQANDYTWAQIDKTTSDIADITTKSHTSLTDIGSNTHAQIDSHISSTSNPHSVTKADVGLGDVENLKVNLAAAAAPTVTDDSSAGYSVGSRWINIVGDEEYVCVDDSAGAAVWSSTTAGGGGAVSSVFSRTGAVVAQANDYTWAQIDKTTSDIADITTKSHTSLTDIGSNTHAQIDSHISSTANPHSVTASQVGLGNVANVDQLPRVLEINNTPSGAYSLLAADNGKLVFIDSGLTIPTGLPVGFQCSVFLNNVSAQTLTTAGNTVLGNDANANISGNGIITVAVTSSNTLLLAGEMEP